MNSLDLDNFSEYDVIRSIIAGTHIVQYGIITEIIDETNVAVKLLIQRNTTETIISCTYLTLNSKVLSTKLLPTIDDKVLVLTLNHKSVDLFDIENTEASIIEPADYQGYNLFGAVAIPVGVTATESFIQVTADDAAVGVTVQLPTTVTMNDLVDIIAKKAATIVAEETLDVTVTGATTITAKDALTVKATKDMTLESTAKAVVKGSAVELNGNSKSFVTWTELNTALNAFLLALNSHTHIITVTSPDGDTATAAAPTPPITLDISSSKTTTVVTGG